MRLHYVKDGLAFLCYRTSTCADKSDNTKTMVFLGFVCNNFRLLNNILTVQKEQNSLNTRQHLFIYHMFGLSVTLLFCPSNCCWVLASTVILSFESCRDPWLYIYFKDFYVIRILQREEGTAGHSPSGRGGGTQADIHLLTGPLLQTNTPKHTSYCSRLD
jgi:hypothetical protein